MAEETGSSRRLASFVALACASVASRFALSYFVGPLTDVYYYDSQAVAAFLTGVNPYGHLFTGIPPALATPGAQSVFAYLPGVLIYLVPFAPFDLRVAMVVAELVVAWAIYSLSGRWSLLASAAFLLLPFDALFSVVYPNNALPAMVFLGAGVVLEDRGKRTSAAGLIAVAAATSQFVWLAYPFFAAMWYRRRGWRELAASLAVAWAVAVPFLAWNPASFVQDTLFFEFSRPVFPLVSDAAWGLNFNPTLTGVSVSLTGSPVPSVVRALILAAMLVVFVGRLKELKPLLIRLGLFLAAAMFVLPGDFFWVYLELPLAVLLMYAAIDPMKRPVERLNA